MTQDEISMIREMVARLDRKEDMDRIVDESLRNMKEKEDDSRRNQHDQ